MVHRMELRDENQPYLSFNISPDLADNARRVLASLHDGSATSLHEGIELLIEAVEASMMPLVTTPKNLMKFNFIVTKTLDGVILLIRELIRRMLRKLGPHVPREFYGTVARHLETFLIV